MFITNNHDWFRLWWKENFVKHQKISKYYDQGCSFNCHSLCSSKCKWDNNHMFLKIILIYFLLLWKVLNTKCCLSKLATRLMFQWKAIFILTLLYICSLLLLHGDIESNPWPRNTRNYLPSFCRWDLNSLPTHNFPKMLLLHGSLS